MTPLQALAFFIREALASLRRGWKVSLLAIVTIAVSLFIGGGFLLLTGNLARVVEEWRDDAKLVVYLDPEAEAGEVDSLVDGVRARPWVTGLERVSSADAEARFRDVFPQLAELLLAGGEGEALPESLEIGYEPARLGDGGRRAWLAELGASAAVTTVDDDRQWLRQVEAINRLVRGVGLLLGGVLLTAATFTVGSVVRLAFYLYRDEIEVLRLVGATEFMIRGPFVVEGLIQGSAGGALAVGALYAGYRLAASRELPTLLGSVLFRGFLSPWALLGLVALGAGAGLAGAALALRRSAET